jgi:DNA-binding GntR family transcriptional regulator
MREDAKRNLAQSVYERLRAELFDFRLLPGDHFSEVEVAERTGASRTPVRQALYRLHNEGFLEVRPRSGWEVRPLNFEQLDALYELRILLEQAAVKRLAALPADRLDGALAALEARWLVPLKKRSGNAAEVAGWDEHFHCSLVAAANNAEFVRVHWDVTERIRIVRRLDFTKAARIKATYDEHSSILRALRRRAFEDAADQLSTHIACSQSEARKITLFKLQSARQSLGAERL